MGSIKCARNTSFSLFFIFFIVSGFAFGTRNWYKDENDILDIHVNKYGGLWQNCTEIGDIRECKTIGFDTKDRDSLYMGTQIAMCVAVGCYLISFICYCVWMSMSQQFLNGIGSTGKAALAFELIGGLSNMAAIAQFAVLFTNDAGKLNYSYYLAVASFVVMTLNSIVTLCTTACSFYTGEQVPVDRSTATTLAIGEVTIRGLEPSDTPSYYPYTADQHINQGYVPESNLGSQTLFPLYPSAPQLIVDDIPPPDYSMIHLYPSMPEPDNPAQVNSKLTELNPDNLDTSLSHPAT